MKHRNTLLWKYGTLTFLGISLLGLVVPLPARAGGVHVSIGFGLPIPVVVVPAPVFVAPAPVIVYRPPVVIEEQRVVYPGYLPPGLAKKFYGYQHVHGDGYYKHWKHHHHDDD